MKDDFFAGLFENARKVANEILDKGESLLRDVEDDLRDNEEIELEDLRMTVDQLEAKNDELQTLVDDLTGTLQVLLDGEMQKDISIPWERWNNLRDASLEIVFTDDDKLNIHIRQER